MKCAARHELSVFVFAGEIAPGICCAKYYYFMSEVYHGKRMYFLVRIGESQRNGSEFIRIDTFES